MTTPQF